MTAATPDFDTLQIGAELPGFERTTGFAHWNRYAAVNDEFIDVHMDREAARAAGQRDVFGMGNLRIAYLHALLHDWLGGRGDVAEFALQFRALNLLGDTLRAWARVAGKERSAGNDQLTAFDTGLFAIRAILKVRVEVEQECVSLHIPQSNPCCAQRVWHAPVAGANIRGATEPELTRRD